MFSRKSTLLLILILFLAAGAGAVYFVTRGGSSKTTKLASVYTQTRTGLTVHYPASWTVKPPSGADTPLLVAPPAKTSATAFTAGLITLISTNLSPKAVAAKEATSPTVHLLTQHDITLGTHHGYFQKLTSTNVTVDTYFLVFPGGDKLIVARFVEKNGSDSYVADLPVFEQILGSISY